MDDTAEPVQTKCQPPSLSPAYADWLLPKVTAYRTKTQEEEQKKQKHHCLLVVAVKCQDDEGS